MIKCNTQANDMAMTANNWQTPGGSDPGRYTEEAHGVPEMDQKSPEAPTRVGACPTPLGAHPYLVAASETP